MKAEERLDSLIPEYSSMLKMTNNIQVTAFSATLEKALMSFCATNASLKHEED